MADFPSLSLDWSNIQVLNEYGKLNLLISMYLIQILLFSNESSVKEDFNTSNNISLKRHRLASKNPLIYRLAELFALAGIIVKNNEILYNYI